MASVLPRKNAGGSVTWRVLFRVDGKQGQESFATEAPARAFGVLVERVGGAAARAQRDARDGNYVGAPTLAEFTETYLDIESGKLTGITDGTRAGYVSMAGRSFLKRMGEIPVDAVTKEDVGRWVAWQARQKSGRSRNTVTLCAPKTIHNYHALLSAIFTASIEAKHRTDNPARSTRLPERDTREAVFLTRDEYDAVLAQVPQASQAFFEFQVATGARWGESTALTWGDLERHTNPPTVRISKAWKKGPNTSPVLGPPKSKKSRRTISIWPELIEKLGTPGAPGDLLFQNALGGHLWHSPTNNRIWKPAVLRSGIGKEPNIHDLRHTSASWLIAQGVPLPYIQARLGHEKITMTVDLYGHLLPTAHTELAEAMQRAMRPIPVTSLPQLEK